VQCSELANYLLVITFSRIERKIVYSSFLTFYVFYHFSYNSLYPEKTKKHKLNDLLQLFLQFSKNIYYSLIIKRCYYILSLNRLKNVYICKCPYPFLSFSFQAVIMILCFYNFQNNHFYRLGFLIPLKNLSFLFSFLKSVFLLHFITFYLFITCLCLKKIMGLLKLLFTA